MRNLVEIIRITEGWEGGHHGALPIVLSVDLESDKPFDITEGWGWGLNGGSLTLSELFTREIATLFDRQESKEIYEFLCESFKAGLDSHHTAKKLLERFTE